METLQTFEKYIPARLLTHFLKQLLVLSAKNEKDISTAAHQESSICIQLSLRIHYPWQYLKCYG